VSVSTRDLTRKIKVKASELGFDSVGVAPASAIPEDRLRTWLRSGYHGKMDYMSRQAEKRLDPDKVLPGVRSVLCVLLDYYHAYDLPYDQPSLGVISRYASGEEYHQLIQGKLRQLLSSIQSLLPQVQARLYVDTGPVMDKYWAAQAGLGWLGKHTNLLDRDRGSWFFLGEILLDVELEYDQPSLDFCGSCTRCIDACPTDAIVEPYVLDARRCISYLTIELRNDIPNEFREPMSNLVFGCDICQDVCPWNRSAPDSSVAEFKPRELSRQPELKQLAQITPEQFPKRFRDSPIKRAKWRGLMRNVAVAMGNSMDPKMVPELSNLLDSEEGMVRRHAAWALAQIATSEALESIRRRLDQEEDPSTRESLERLLAPVAPDKSSSAERVRFGEP